MTVLNLFYLPNDTRVKVLRKLKQWAEPLGNMYDPAIVRKAVLQRQSQSLAPPDTKTPPSQCESDARTLGVIFAGDVFIQRREPELLPLIEAYRTGKEEARVALEAHIDKNWCTNPTVLDMDHEA